jgi:hypothetical protein
MIRINQDWDNKNHTPTLIKDKNGNVIIDKNLTVNGYYYGTWSGEVIDTTLTEAKVKSVNNLVGDVNLDVFYKNEEMVLQKNLNLENNKLYIDKDLQSNISYDSVLDGFSIIGNQGGYLGTNLKQVLKWDASECNIYDNLILNNNLFFKEKNAEINYLENFSLKNNDDELVLMKNNWFFKYDKTSFENINLIEDSIDHIQKLKPIYFSYKNDINKNLHIGLDLEEKYCSFTMYTPLLIAGIQELNLKISQYNGDLTTYNNTLKKNKIETDKNIENTKNVLVSHIGYEKKELNTTIQTIKKELTYLINNNKSEIELNNNLSKKHLNEKFKKYDSEFEQINTNVKTLQKQENNITNLENEHKILYNDYLTNKTEIDNELNNTKNSLEKINNKLIDSDTEFHHIHKLLSDLDDKNYKNNLKFEEFKNEVHHSNENILTKINVNENKIEDINNNNLQTQKQIDINNNNILSLTDEINNLKTFIKDTKKENIIFREKVFAQIKELRDYINTFKLEESLKTLNDKNIIFDDSIQKEINKNYDLQIMVNDLVDDNKKHVKNYDDQIKILHSKVEILQNMINNLQKKINK